MTIDEQTIENLGSDLISTRVAEFHRIRQHYGFAINCQYPPHEDGAEVLLGIAHTIGLTRYDEPELAVTGPFSPEVFATILNELLTARRSERLRLANPLSILGTDVGTDVHLRDVNMEDGDPFLWLRLSYPNCRPDVKQAVLGVSDEEPLPPKHTTFRGQLLL